MSDGAYVVLLVAITVVGGGLWLIASLIRAAGDAVAAGQRGIERSRAWVEVRMLELLVQYPTADDGAIAQLVVDELVNLRSQDRHAFEWATAYQAGRIRRNLHRQVRL